MSCCCLPARLDVRSCVCVTLRVTQQQVRTRLCSSDSRTHSSPSPWPLPDVSAIRELMALPMSQKDGGVSKAEERDLLCSIIKPSDLIIVIYLLYYLLPFSVAQASLSP